MPDRRTFALQFRIGIFVVISLIVFLGVIYLLGARAPTSSGSTSSTRTSLR
jgi:hypothetical protein